MSGYSYYSTGTGGGGSGSWSRTGTWAPVAPGSGNACLSRGCRAQELEEMLSGTLNITQELLANQEKEAKRLEPTKALWCEQGGHSFSEKDPGYQVLSITGKDEEGKQVTESRTICGPCAVQTKTTLGGARNAPASELPASDS